MHTTLNLHPHGPITAEARTLTGKLVPTTVVLDIQADDTTVTAYLSNDPDTLQAAANALVAAAAQLSAAAHAATL